MTAKAKPFAKNGERVRRTDTGEVATYVQVHEKGAHTVLLLDADATVVWEAETPLDVVPGHRPPWPVHRG